MKDKQAGDPDGFDGNTYRLTVFSDCFATNEVVRTNTDQRALAARGAK